MPAFTHKEKFTLTEKKIGSMGENRELRMPEIWPKVGPKPAGACDLARAKPHAVHGGIYKIDFQFAIGFTHRALGE